MGGREGGKSSSKVAFPGGEGYVWSHVYMYGHTYSKSMDQPGKVANPACGQLNTGNEYFPVRVRA